jgi:hypothetical protein
MRTIDRPTGPILIWATAATGMVLRDSSPTGTKLTVHGSLEASLIKEFLLQAAML